MNTTPQMWDAEAVQTHRPPVPVRLVAWPWLTCQPVPTHVQLSTVMPHWTDPARCMLPVDIHGTTAYLHTTWDAVATALNGGDPIDF